MREVGLCRHLQAKRFISDTGPVWTEFGGNSSNDHSALGLAKRVCPDPFLRDGVGVPRVLPLMDGDHSALGLAKRVCPDPFLRDGMGVPQGQTN
ncbi:hypothetical protein R3I93_014291 [Phoxinus phoxinus]|uniref:Uncharacterized protein n=1 Tax=Phoxinus phoxinus TaxID=58324 RepID=A0AAN9CPL4_9TELE